jgi:RNA polymerase sigma factor (TIGR02999 family)
MTGDPRDHVTALLASYDEAEGLGSAAREEAAAELLPAVYDELRRLAQTYMTRERGEHSLQATGLVHEAYLRLVRQDRVSWRGRRHFFAVAAQVMRRLLVDHARRRRSHKRGGDWQRVTLEGLGPLLGHQLAEEELLALDRALERLAALDPRQAEVVELRFFAGLEVAEVAATLGVSKRTVEGEWTHARAWLRRELAGEPAAAPP